MNPSGTLLPTTLKEALSRGWESLDVILVTGDAYVDHPSYGSSVIGRVLENAGFRVGIISQPDTRSKDDFMRLGKPGFFFGVTAGNLDSMIANYTANRKPRSEDDYSPGGVAGLRPDRACIIYTNKIREAFPGIPVVLGGLEASLRRLAHYDYWQDKVRRSILLDSKADILVYGMGETQVVDIAKRIKGGDDIKSINGIRGTCIIRNSVDDLQGAVTIPSFEETSSDNNKFNEAYRTTYLESDPIRGKTIVQKHGDRFIIQLPPALPLSEADLDRIYSLNYARSWHPSYYQYGGVPGFETVKFSVISHRGCSAACSFCSLNLHQGRIIQNRSAGSILNEIRQIASRDDFKGTITDIGGPTANMYAASCESWPEHGACRDKHCIGKERCQNLKIGYDKTIDLWNRARKTPGVKHIFIGSGVRYDLLLENDAVDYLKELCRDHVSGQLKVAPEHSESSVLELMNKPSFDKYDEFSTKYRRLNKLLKKDQYLVNYFISGHPGTTLNDCVNFSLKLIDRRLRPEQIQDFIPLPMTTSGCMYYTGRDPFTGKEVHVPKGRERVIHRALLQYWKSSSRRYIIEALSSLKRMDLQKRYFRK